MELHTQISTPCSRVVIVHRLLEQPASVAARATTSKGSCSGEHRQQFILEQFEWHSRQAESGGRPLVFNWPLEASRQA